jgi:hypothetical protein
MSAPPRRNASRSPARPSFSGWIGPSIQLLLWGHLLCFSLGLYADGLHRRQLGIQLDQLIEREFVEPLGQHHHVDLLRRQAESAIEDCVGSRHAVARRAALDLGRNTPVASPSLNGSNAIGTLPIAG